VRRGRAACFFDGLDLPAFFIRLLSSSGRVAEKHRVSTKDSNYTRFSGLVQRSWVESLFAPVFGMSGKPAGRCGAAVRRRTPAGRDARPVCAPVAPAARPRRAVRSGGRCARLGQGGSLARSDSDVFP